MANEEIAFDVQYALDNERRMTRIEGKIDEMMQLFKDHIAVDKERWASQNDRDNGQDKEIAANKAEFAKWLKRILGIAVTIILTLAGYILGNT
jgi:hypothetical protein